MANELVQAEVLLAIPEERRWPLFAIMRRMRRARPECEVLQALQDLQESGYVKACTEEGNASKGAVRFRMPEYLHYWLTPLGIREHKWIDEFGRVAFTCLNRPRS